MKKQEKTTYLNEKRGLKYALCIITLLCCLLNTVTHAEETEYPEREYDARNVSSVRMYGLDDYSTNPSWRLFNVIRDGNRAFHSPWFGYGQSGERIEFSIARIYIRQIKYDYKIYAANSSLTDITKAFYVNSVATANQKGIPKVTETGNKKTLNNKEYKEYRVEGEHIFNPVEVHTLFFQTNVGFVSSEMYVEDFLIIVNDEYVYTLKDWEDKQGELEEALKDIEVTVDQNAIDDIINNPPTIDSTINVGIFNFTNETIPLYIMSLTLSLAIISFLLYGKK